MPSEELPLVAQSRSVWDPRSVPRIRTDTGLLLAAIGLGDGTALDLAIVGVVGVAVRVAAHQIALTVGLGIATLGTGRTDRRTVNLVFAIWGGMLITSLGGFV